MKPDNISKKISQLNLADLSGEELVQLWKAGNEGAAEILADRYSLRLIALVASKLNQRFRHVTDPEDIVQSALGSFFDAAANSRIHVSNSLSLWRLLATFARRKMSKTIDKYDSLKRGGGQRRVSLESAEQAWPGFLSDVADQDSAAERLLAVINIDLPEKLQSVLHGLLAGRSQKEISGDLDVDERTVRRRVVEIRKILAPELKSSNQNAAPKVEPASLPRVNYSEFVLGKLIGSGGFGKVYRASMQQDGSIVAVKFLRKGFWHHAEARQSFLREIETASKVQHAGVIRYHGWGESPHGAPYVISQWIDGRTLGDARTVSPEVFCGYLIQVCLAMAEVHRADIVHGDLTPSNILIDQSGRITITDFGFSQRRSNNSLNGSTSEDNDFLLGGTVGFAAPEQFSNAFGTIGPRTDIYGLGAIAYWYLTGRAPHQASSLEKAIGDTVSEADVKFDSCATTSPLTNSIQQFAQAALKKSVSSRPDSVELLKKLL